MFASTCEADIYVVTVSYRSGEVKREEFFDRSAAQSSYNLANAAKGTKLIPGPVLSVTLQTVATPGGIATAEYKQRIKDSYEAAKTLEKEQSKALDRMLDNIFKGAEDKSKSLADAKATSEILTPLSRAKVDAIALAPPGAERRNELESLKKLDVIGRLAEETVREDEFYREIETTLTSSGFYRPKVVNLRKELAARSPELAKKDDATPSMEKRTESTPATKASPTVPSMARTTWRSTAGDNYRYRFLADGTFVGEFLPDPNARFVGKWKQEGNVLFSKSTANSPWRRSTIDGNRVQGYMSLER
jgi:hypothetical protein